MQRLFTVVMLLTLDVALANQATSAANGNALPVAGAKRPGAKLTASKNIIFVVDYSESVKTLEDTTQALVCHCFKIAEVSGQPVAFAVIFFGGDGVQVFPAQGGPTTSHKALHHDLLKHWPKPKGGTPLDAAMQAVVHLVQALPRGSDVAVVLFTDGEPSSGWLRPEAFPEVKAEVDRQVQAIQKNPKGYPPAIVQQLLARLEKELLDARSERCKKLYEIQVKAEFKKTLDHAQALKQAKVRFISVDYDNGIPALKQIHDAAGGLAADLVITEPAGAVAQLHRLGLTSLPQVIVQDPKRVVADAKAFERLVPLKLDAVGDRAVVTLVFEKPVGDFAKHLVLESTFDGSTLPFSIANDEPARILSFDSAGKVATAHLIIDRIPTDRQLTLSLKSPSQSMSMPACTVYVHLRVAKDIVPQFRPQHAPTDAAGPFRISPNQEARWLTAYRSKENPKPYPVKSIDALLRNVQTGVELRLEMRLDPHVAFTFGSDPVRLPRGTFDVTLETILESGASIRTLMPRQVTSELGDEFISLEILPKTGQGVEHFSHQPGHVDFGEVGDDRLQGKVAVILRSMGVAYDIPVEISVEGLADANGKAPKESWLVPDRKTILLKPGRAEQLFLTLKVPDRIEDEIVDGLFKGQLVFLRQDLSEPMPVKRFRPISGVADDEPTDLLTFTLRRPKLEVRAPRCLRNSLGSAKDGRQVLPVNDTIARPFDRTVTLVVRHSSVVSRSITLLPEGSFVDMEGRQVPYVRLLPEDKDALTRDIAPGSSATWRLRFEADELYDLRKAIGKIVVSGPGLPTMHITVEIRGRDPLLGPAWQRVLWIVGLLLVASLLYALVRYWQARRFREDNEVIVTEQRALAGYLGLKATGKEQVTLVPLQPVCYQFGSEPKKRLAENRPLTLKCDGISADRPLFIEQQTSDGEEGWRLAFQELLLDPPEVRGTIQSAPVQAQEASRRWMQIRRRFLWAAVILFIAAMFFTPWVVRSAQWLYDFIPW